MAVTVFEKHITKYEVTNQCFILEDDAQKSYAYLFNNVNEKFLVHTNGHRFDAILREFYVKDKFKHGIYFHHDEGHVSDYFFDNSIVEGKRAKITVDDSLLPIDGKMQITIEIIVITRPH